MQLTNKCIHYVNIGIIIRLFLTFVSFTILYNYKSLIGKNIYLILPILLLLLDKCDNMLLCTKTFYYQINDKIVDMLSYLLLYFIIPFNPLFQILIIYRLVGVILFAFTRLSIPLIIFFDFVKEYLFYFYLFGNNNMYLPIFMVCKIIVEYILHTKINKVNYSNRDKSL
jgi:hypothetical protein